MRIGSLGSPVALLSNASWTGDDRVVGWYLGGLGTPIVRPPGADMQLKAQTLLGSPSHIPIFVGYSRRVPGFSSCIAVKRY